jgi:hypothetical protein
MAVLQSACMRAYYAAAAAAAAAVVSVLGLQIATTTAWQSVEQQAIGEAALVVCM